MYFLFLFMDGIGIGEDNPETNPLALAKSPTLQALLGGKRLVRGTAPLETERAMLMELDAGLGIKGLPQSATGQAVLVTGKNVPQIIGEHYGPKPNKKVAEILRADNLFKTLTERGYKAALLNAYPQRYFEAIESGKRLYSSIPLAVTSAGIPLKTADDYYAGEAFSVDFTGQGWRTTLGYKDAPLYGPREAGERLAKLVKRLDFAFFEFWPSDYAGHHQDMLGAISLLESFDAVLGGLLAEWEDDKGLILITSDHGNMEDLSTRHHTNNPVPALVIGSKLFRDEFCAGLKDLTDIAPTILQFYPMKVQ